MATKMKGLLKGLRYISQIFDEEKEEDIQIGFPTDVKHVAHIGWDDGPKSVNNDSPGWMDDFKSSSTEVFQSAPLGPSPEPSSNGSSSDKNDPHVKWVSEDSKRSSRRATGSSNKDELPKSSRRHSMNTNNDDESSSSPKKKDPSSKPRQSRRHKEGPPPQDLTTTSTTTCSQQVPADIPRKSRRKKSKEEGGSTRSRSKPTNDTSYDPDPDPAPVVLPKPNHDDLDYPRQSRVTFKDC